MNDVRRIKQHNVKKEECSGMTKRNFFYLIYSSHLSRDYYYDNVVIHLENFIQLTLKIYFNFDDLEKLGSFHTLKHESNAVQETVIDYSRNIAIRCPFSSSPALSPLGTLINKFIFSCSLSH
jgi:hypothetical protein